MFLNVEVGLKYFNYVIDIVVCLYGRCSLTISNPLKDTSVNCKVEFAILKAENFGVYFKVSLNTLFDAQKLVPVHPLLLLLLFVLV